jgi:hypothetical protein
LLYQLKHLLVLLRKRWLRRVAADADQQRTQGCCKGCDVLHMGLLTPLS